MEIGFICPMCGNEHKVPIKDVEEIIYSSPHNPDIDYLKCSECPWAENIIYRPYPVTLYKGYKSKQLSLFSDSFNLYLSENGTHVSIIMIAEESYDF